MNMTLKPAFGLSGSALKVISMISMVIDHIALYLMEHGTVLYETMRCIGRIAFPVFAFLIAEGFIHTRNRYRYFFTLLGFAVISEIPWYLLNGADGTHNVMFTLALGVMALATFEALKKDGILSGFTILIIAFFASWFGVDYGWRGIILIVVFYLMKNINKIISHYSIMIYQLLVFPLMIHFGIVGTILAFIIILFYNGVRGFIHSKSAKYGFYAFYPVHLFILYVL